MNESSTNAIDAALSLLQRNDVKDAERNINDISILLQSPSSNNDNNTNNNNNNNDNNYNEYVQQEFLQIVDKPLLHPQTIIDTTSNKKFIPTEYNQEQYSFRSPWSNQLFPPLTTSTTTTTTNSNNTNNNNEDGNNYHGYGPSPSLRQLEIQANEIFESYTQLYYGRSNDEEIMNGKNEIVSSVYFWDKDTTTRSTTSSSSRSGGDRSSTSSSNSVRRVGGTSSRIDTNDPFMTKGFNGCFLIKKQMSDDGNDNGMKLQKGIWNSIHHVDVGPTTTTSSTTSAAHDGKCKYTISSTILLSMDININMKQNQSSSSSSSSQQTIHVSGSLSKQIDKTISGIQRSTDHISNIGKVIEDVEIELRTNLDVLYIQKTKEIFDSIRPSEVMNNYNNVSFGGSTGTFGKRNRPTAGGGGGSIPMPGMMMMGLPSATQNEMNAALMARFKKVGNS